MNNQSINFGSDLESIFEKCQIVTKSEEDLSAPVTKLIINPWWQVDVYQEELNPDVYIQYRGSRSFNKAIANYFTNTNFQLPEKNGIYKQLCYRGTSLDVYHYLKKEDDYQVSTPGKSSLFFSHQGHKYTQWFELVPMSRTVFEMLLALDKEETPDEKSFDTTEELFNELEI